MSSLNELKKLHAKGLALIYLHPKQKRPLESGWTTQKPKSWDELENSHEPSYNVGVRLGQPSKLISGKYIGAIDCDVKATSRKAQVEMNETLRKLGLDLDSAPIVMSGRGNGSKHIYVQTTEPMKPMKYAQSIHRVKVLMPGEKKEHSKTERHELTPKEMEQGYRIRAAWEISFMGTGQQTVLPPSIHPDTGMKYAWASPLMVKHLPTFHPSKFVSQKQESNQAVSIEGLDFKAVDVDLWKTDLPVSIIKMIQTGEGCEDHSAALKYISKNMIRLKFTDNQILSVLSNPDHYIAETAHKHTQSRDRGRAVQWLYKYTLLKAKYETDIMRRFENKPSLIPLTESQTSKLDKELDAEKRWQDDLQKNDKRGYKNSLTNVELILSNLQSQTVFVHDLFSTRDSYGTDTVWGGIKSQHLTDIDLIKIRRWLSGSSFSIEPGKDLVLDSVKFIADRNKTHPVREWLKSLEWDGVPRIGTWMRDYLHSKAEEPYLTEVSRIFLLAMVKRVFEPGCQWDYTVVLEGNQGTYKSTTARVLAGDKWFMDNLPDLRDKDAMLNLQGKWVIELGELADVKRGDYNAVKAYLNRRVDTVRSPYGHLPNDIPRQSVFIGTVNEGEYLKDPTGNRRFWPVKVGICDVKRLRIVREQLFAEAMWVYENCFDGNLSMGREANKQATIAQADRRISDDSTEMQESLLSFIEENENKPRKLQFDFEKFKAKDLFNIFDGPWKEWGGKGWAFNVAAQTLSIMGFKKKKIRGQQWWGIDEYKLSSLIKE